MRPADVGRMVQSCTKRPHLTTATAVEYATRYSDGSNKIRAIAADPTQLKMSRSLTLGYKPGSLCILETSRTNLVSEELGI